MPIKKQNLPDTSIELEAEAFNCQINERMRHGHIPDLRLTKECTWFYNNSWRHPEYVKLDFGEQFELISQSLQICGNHSKKQLSVLEVGCGPGYLSLELARAGHCVVGVDISSECIQVAKKTASADPWKQQRGPLRYICGEFLIASKLKPDMFDAVIFLASLHHFPNQDEVMTRVKSLLSRKGLIIVHEPTRDRVTKGNAAFLQLIHTLLSINNGFHCKTEIPPDKQALMEQVDILFTALKYENEKGEKVQSVHDNESGHKEMYAALSKNFQEVAYKERYAFFHDVIGGLRFDESTNVLLAQYLRNCDAMLCELGVLQSTEFLFVGRKTDTLETAK